MHLVHNGEEFDNSHHEFAKFFVGRTIENMAFDSSIGEVFNAHGVLVDSNGARQAFFIRGDYDSRGSYLRIHVRDEEE